MRRAVVVRQYPQGRRVWLLGQRCHHGSVGCLLVLASFRGSLRLAALLGAALAYHDRADWRAWFAREGVPAGNEA